MLDLPLEYALIGFEGDKFSGKIVPELLDLAERGIVRFVDIVFIQKEEDGTTNTFELNDLDPEMYELVSPQNPYFYNMLGRLQEVNKETAKAEANYKKAIEIDPNISGFYTALGNFYLREKLTEKAIGEYHAAIQKTPNSLPARMGLGILYETLKKYDKAKEYYQKVLKINPRFVPAQNNLAYLYAETGGNTDEALTLAQSAKAQFPDDPYIPDTLGWVYYKKNVFSRAIVYLKEASEKIPNNPMIRYHLGMAYFKNGEKENAERELKKALELDPKFTGAEEAKDTLSKLK